MPVKKLTPCISDSEHIGQEGLCGGAKRLNRGMVYFSFALVLMMLSSCTPMTHPPGIVNGVPQLNPRDFVAADGARLPLRSWLPVEKDTEAVIIALHGMNDYSNFFDAPARYFVSEGIACYAYDQRGFGLAPGRGSWAGIDAYANDLSQITRLLKARHVGAPVYLLGESMGGATVIVAATGDNAPDADGVILLAPAVWGRKTMPWYQRIVLWLSAHTVPWMTLTGEGLGVKPSDNIPMLRSMSRDPLVIKETRIGTVHGLVDLMDAALAQAANISLPTLMLYGERDEIVPKQPTYQMLKTIPEDRPLRAAIYENGYHMLLRDLQAKTLWQDIAGWIENKDRSLVSGADRRAEMILSAFTS